MEINKSLKERIKEINLVMQGTNMEELRKQFCDLLMVFDRTDREQLDNGIINEIKKLKSKILISNVKSKLKEISEKERKLSKMDDFKELCNLMKYNQFDEALKRFYERNK